MIEPLKTYWNKEETIIIQSQISLEKIGLDEKEWDWVCTCCGQKLTKRNQHKTHKIWCKDCYTNDYGS